jgi:ABC-type multidrug transport system fused ATPase/permease subunit
MEPSVFKFILRHSLREQITLLVLTVCSFPLLYYSLDLPKTIINEAISGVDFPRSLFGHEVEQVPYLFLLSGIFLCLVLVNGGFKYVINVYRGVLGERMLRRLRYLLYARVLRFPLPQFRKLSQGEMVAMITAETEDIGGFIGDAISLPAFQGGTLLTILVFMFLQDPILGTAAIALYPVQAWLIPKLQRKLNLLKKERLLKVRRLSERIGETVTSIRDVHANDTAQYELADYSEHLGGIYRVRFEIYKQKFLIKFLNNFIAQITPFFFYSIGGYLVIAGDLSFGALVAVLAAYKDLSAPWKELLDYYQTKEDARIRYDLLLETFEPAGLLAEHIQVDEPDPIPHLDGPLRAVNVALGQVEEEAEDEGSGNLMNFSVDLPLHVALVGPEGSGKHRLADALSGISRPARGQILVNGIDLIAAPSAVTGRRVAYVSQQPTLRNASVRDNLLYVLQHRPEGGEWAHADEDTRRHAASERRLSGNSPYDIHQDWVDFQGVGVSDAGALGARLQHVLELVGLADDIYDLGLGQRIDPQVEHELADGVLRARELLWERLRDPELAPLVERFDSSRYNSNMSVVENLVFGAPNDPAFEFDCLASNAQVREVLGDFGLYTRLIGIGGEVAELMLDLFADVEPDSPMFEQYSFIDADDLPRFRGLLSRSEGVDPETLSSEDATDLLSLSFKLIVSRHRLGLIDESIQARLLEARQVVRQRFAVDQGSIESFDVAQVNSAVSLQDNILFGRLAHGRARSAAQVGELIREVVDSLDLRRKVVERGLDFQVGIGGSRLSVAKRQKLALARAILKRPDILVLDEPTASFDERTQLELLRRIREEFQGRSLFWVLHEAAQAVHFDTVLVLEDGRVKRSGPYDELSAPGGPLSSAAEAGE